MPDSGTKLKNIKRVYSKSTSLSSLIPLVNNLFLEATTVTNI